MHTVEKSLRSQPSKMIQFGLSLLVIRTIAGLFPRPPNISEDSVTDRLNGLVDKMAAGHMIGSAMPHRALYSPFFLFRSNRTFTLTLPEGKCTTCSHLTLIKVSMNCQKSNITSHAHCALTLNVSCPVLPVWKCASQGSTCESATKPRGLPLYINCVYVPKRHYTWFQPFTLYAEETISRREGNTRQKYYSKYWSRAL